MNISFITGVPRVIPIHRGSTVDKNNYPPISLLSVFNKIMEKLMHKRLYSFMEESNILYDKQFWFRKNNSTINDLITNHCKWFESYLSNRKQFVHVNGENSDLTELSCGVPLLWSLKALFRSTAILNIH